jgi:hypothetical protein
VSLPRWPEDHQVLAMPGSPAFPRSWLHGLFRPMSSGRQPCGGSASARCSFRVRGHRPAARHDPDTGGTEIHRSLTRPLRRPPSTVTPSWAGQHPSRVLAGLRSIRNRMAHDVDLVDFAGLEAVRPDPGDGRIAAWVWQWVSPPVTKSSRVRRPVGRGRRLRRRARRGRACSSRRR